MMVSKKWASWLVCGVFVLATMYQPVRAASSEKSYQRFAEAVRKDLFGEGASLLSLSTEEGLDWKSANKKSYDAMQADQTLKAIKYGRQSLVLYHEVKGDYKAGTHLQLMDNLVSLELAGNLYETAAASIILGISEKWRRDAAPSKTIVEFGLLYGRLTDAQIRHRARIHEQKQARFFWKKIQSDAADKFGEGSFEHLSAKYYGISGERRYKKERWIGKPLNALLEESIAANEVQPAMMALTMWSAIKMFNNDHDEALERIADTLQSFGEEGIPDAYSYKLFNTVAAYHFPKYGREKTEKIMIGMKGLKSRPRKPGDDDSVGLVPLKRVTPGFTNIREERFVVYEFAVDADGSPTDIVTLQSNLGERNEKNGRKAIEGWEYIPAFVDGKFIRTDGVRVQFTVQPPRFR